IHRQLHPEEPRRARRLEGWATSIVFPTLRDGPAGLLRVRLGPYQRPMKAGTRIGAIMRRRATGSARPIGLSYLPFRHHAEALRLDTQRGVELRAEILEGDRCRQLD